MSFRDLESESIQNKAFDNDVDDRRAYLRPTMERASTLLRLVQTTTTTTAAN